MIYKIKLESNPYWWYIRAQNIASAMVQAKWLRTQPQITIHEAKQRGLVKFELA